MNENQVKESNTSMKRFQFILDILYVFQGIRGILHILLFLGSPQKKVIEKDIERWLEIIYPGEYPNIPGWKGLIWLLWHHQEYRNLFYYRIHMEYRLISRMALEAAKLFYHPRDTLFLKAETIGEGLFIQHGYCTGIGGNIGKNCWINQHVVIGYSDEDKSPTIGDNVRITVGAKVIGDVTIGDNSVVGANAVVVKNVPPNCTVVGIPAYIVKRDGKKVKEPL
jgi:serine O-acetyltransferase